MPEIVVIAHNIRSTHNVGAIFRTAEGFGVTKIILSGYTPHPAYPGDTRLPHIRDKLTAQIHKSALGAEEMVPFIHMDIPPIAELKKQGYIVTGLEQAPNSISIDSYAAPQKVALMIGEEVSGISPELLGMCDDIVEIPMHGHKESFNVSVATGIALYQFAQFPRPII